MAPFVDRPFCRRNFIFRLPTKTVELPVWALNEYEAKIAAQVAMEVAKQQGYGR